jgi:DNA ligase 1
LDGELWTKRDDF